MLATAESCTGGMIAGALTDQPGSSAVLDRGFITYSNDAKIDMVGVRAETLDLHGAVSRQSAIEMAQGALARSRAKVAVAVTGIAGPSGGTAEKPVGMVHFAVARTGAATIAVERLFGGIGRAEIRAQSVLTALRLVLDALSQE